MPDDDLSDVTRRLNALGQLSAGVGHHVINAFATVVSNAEILRLTKQMPGAADPIMIADMIIKTSVDASGVARRLIDYSRAATGTGPELIALDRLAAEIIGDEQASRPSGIAWEGRLSEVPPIRGDGAQLRAMIGLLTTNALEAMSPQGGTIILVTGLDDRGWVVLEIQDDGCGLTREVQERAVEPFFSTKPGHMGVGLSIANGIWRRHRGTLAIRGRPGEGTSVRLCVEPARDGVEATR